MSQPTPPIPEERIRQLQQGQSLPVDMPPQWLEKISQAASRAPLPELPDSWLNKIKEATKPNLLGTILGSSLLAALIAFGSSILTAYITNRGQQQVEEQKVKQDAKNKVANAYVQLLDKLSGLDMAVEGYYDFSHITHDKAALNAQLDNVGLAQAALIGAEKNTALNDKVRAEVDRVLSDLTPVIADARSHPETAVSQLKPLLTELRDLSRQLSQEMTNSQD